ncbi:MAG: MotA/TolQ/ExbB proton channel family protein [Dysgonamonadaceae bacterium]|jgi:biopolymer transport protein ExbB|nr:MotA/TolQ/ExbB proton channel family protein [Dysgonamonadaceae bacterium]
METKSQVGTKREGKRTRGVNAVIVIIGAFVLAVGFYLFILGDPSHFEGAKSNSEVWTYKFHPKNGDMLGTMFMGGFVVPIILTLLLTVFILSFERAFALAKAKGHGNLINFVYDVKKNLKKGDITAAESLCAKQKGSVAAIVDAGLKKYKEMETQNLPKETKIEEIKAELEEATALELPSMQQNLPIIATISTLGTLMGLFGTVLGMIKSFSALGTAGAVDSVALSVGISEALVNTATGIATGALAIIAYSFFSGKIDNMTYAIDEMGFALTQTYAETHNS